MIIIKIRIFNEDDRMVVASILIKNGYRVEQNKEPRPRTKSVDYILIVEDVREEKE